MKLKLLLGTGCVCLLAVIIIFGYHRPNAKQRTAEGLALLDQSQHEFSAAEYQAAERSSRQAVKIFRGLAREYPQHRYYPQHLGHSLWVLSDTLSATGKKDEAERVAGEALQVFEKAAGQFPRVPFLRQEQAFSLRKIGERMESAGKLDGAEQRAQLSAGLYAGLKQEFPTNAFYALEEAYSAWMAAGILEHAGRPDEAEEQYRQAMSLHETAIRNFPNDPEFKNRLQAIRDHFADLLQAQGKTAEAEAIRNPTVNASDSNQGGSKQVLQ